MVVSRLLDGGVKRLQANASFFRIELRRSVELINNDETEPRNIHGGVRSDLCDRRHLVHAVALSILPEQLLRSLGAKFLPLPGRLSRCPPLCLLPLSPKRAPPGRQALSRLPYPGVAERRPPDHANGRSFSYGPRRLRHLRAFLGHFHRAPRTDLFS